VDQNRAATRQPRKATWIALLIPCALIIGLLAGMLVGAMFAHDDGLAGGATVLFYGIVGLVVGAVMIAVLARRLSATNIKVVSIGALVVSTALIGLVAWQFVERKRVTEKRSRISDEPVRPRDSSSRQR
jgi:uncharacterized membrane protein YhaH (DUF805 family)